jgi:hypothetical protein
MLRNYDRHLSPVRRHPRLCHCGADAADSLPSAPQPAMGPEVGLPITAVERGSVDSPISGRCYGWIAETTKRRTQKNG